MSIVKVWEEMVTIPTYPVGKKEKNPLFLEKRVYQGSSGAVYPYPVIESVGKEKEDKQWKALYLENKYLKIMILPELGGRVQMAYDKTNDYHFVYYNQVIKPALVGLAGPWISGGIEFNWPQHHRPGTYEPTDHMYQENEDGSAVIWVGEQDHIGRTRCSTAFVLQPDKAVLEVEARLYNGSNTPRTFLWWANPAVAVGDSYQSIFPPDVHAVMDHGKRDVSTFPIATGTYYKMDYSKGVDISRYKNLPVPTSYMAYHSDYDFMGCYDHEKQAGMLHVANHHLVPGKKQWTWGNGDFGQAWDRNLTDEDGPYIELMTGAFTDNQPDFSWLLPGEEKIFHQNFMPYKELDSVDNASTRAALSLQLEEDEIRMGVYTMGPEKDLSLELKRGSEIIFTQPLSLSPEKSYHSSFPRPAGSEEREFSLVLRNDTEEILSAWKEVDKLRPIPEPAKAAPPAEEIGSTEELFLTGLHLEQYRHATRNPEDYYREGLKRDPGESRCHTALGKREMLRGRFSIAKDHFRQAIKRQTFRNPNPYDGEALFHLGWTLRYLGQDEEAYEKFYKSIWNGPWQGAGYCELARLSCTFGNMEQALLEVDRAIAAGRHNRNALHLKAMILRKSGKKADAVKVLEELEAVDPLNHAAAYERYLLHCSEKDLKSFQTLIRNDQFSYLELALDYLWSAAFNDAIALLTLLTKEKTSAPLPCYYLGYLYEKTENQKDAETWYRLGAEADPSFCFPSRTDSIMILEHVIKSHPSDTKAPYYAGNFYYHYKNYDAAIRLWQKASDTDKDFPTVRRNLALGAYNKEKDPEKALKLMEEAFFLDESDHRILFELDQLYKKLGRSPEKRLAFLHKYPEGVAARDDLNVEKLTLLNITGKEEEALKIMGSRQFQPWEGGEGRVSTQYVRSLILLGLKELKKDHAAEALRLLEKAYSYPCNLGEGKLCTITDNELDYYRGLALNKTGRKEEALQSLLKATKGDQEPAASHYYNDQSADLIYFQGLAQLQMGNPLEARQRFNKLLSWGKSHFHDQTEIDYFAVSLPDLLIFDQDGDAQNQLYCRYLMALGEYGMGNTETGRKLLEEVLREDPVYPGAAFFKTLWDGDFPASLSC